MLGPVLKPEWIQLEGVPFHAWDERVFTCLGECLGIVMEVDTKAKQRKRIDMVRVLILSGPLRSLPESLVLEVSRLDSLSPSEWKKKVVVWRSICHRRWTNGNLH